MFALIFFQITILFSTAAFAPEEPVFSAPPPAPQTFSQSLPLHTGWNLVSWNIVPPDNTPQTALKFDDILDPNDPNHNNDWFWEHSGKLWQWDHAGILDFYGLGGDLPAGTEWKLPYAYYFLLTEPHPWEFTESLLTAEAFDVNPDPAWNLNTRSPVYEARVGGWFFLGYQPNGYTKLATVYNTWPPPSGAGTYEDYRGPFHWMYWDQNSTTKIHYLCEPDSQCLVIVKTDDGKVYIPYDPTIESQIFENGEPDEIGQLQPGRGYFLGFKNQTGRNYGMHNFSWAGYPNWNSGNSFKPDPKENQPQISSGAHFQFQPYTHFFYPVFVDSVVVEGDTIQIGDEIGVFDGDLCVGSIQYQGTFPVKINAWQDDIATPQDVDGYQPDNEMIFKLYDQSRNAEFEFEPPPMVMGEDDDPIAPNHSGFGAGFYALRNFVYGVKATNQLPQEFKLNPNYPNPFNSATVIPLELPQRSKIRIEVFNVKGQRVGNLYESIENAGYPKVYYNASQLSSGVYFCRVTAKGLERSGKYQGVSKMVLMK